MNKLVTTMSGRTYYDVRGGAEGVVSADCILNVKITDISTAGSTFVVCPIAGKIKTIYSTIKNSISVANAALTFEIGGTVVTGAGITVAYSGSAAGDVDSSTPTAKNTLTAGQAIECITNGGSTTACETVLTIVITPTT